jgi:hypothetical protein
MTIENKFEGSEHLLPTSKPREEFLSKWEEVLTDQAVISNNAKRYKITEEQVISINQVIYDLLLEDEGRGEDWLLIELHKRLGEASAIEQ